MRPLMRGGKVVLPILPQRGQNTVVEVVAVLEQAIPAGRSQLAIDLMQVAAPVLEHSWRLLLPDGPKYRYAGGNLLPVPAALPRLHLGHLRENRSAGTLAADLPTNEGGVQEEALEAIVSTSGLLHLPAAPAMKDKKERRDENEQDVAKLNAASYADQIGELQQGLVGGVKPLPITIPESGKALVLTGVLPPERVSVLLDVKAAKK
jgi:hypothetical protein